MLLTKFRVNWHVRIGEEAKKKREDFQDFQDYDRHDFSYFDLRHPNASYQVSNQLAFRFRRRSEKQIFKMAAMVAILDWRSE